MGRAKAVKKRRPRQQVWRARTPRAVPGRRRVVVEGHPFEIGANERPLVIYKSALISFDTERHLFFATWPGTARPAHHGRQAYRALDRIKRYISGKEETSGGLDPLPPAQRPLVAIERSRGVGRGCTWEIGRLVRPLLSASPFRTAWVVEVRGEQRELATYDRVYVCDDPKIIDELNKLEKGRAELEERYDKIHRKLERIRPRNRLQAIGEAKKQHRRLRNKPQKRRVAR